MRTATGLAWPMALAAALWACSVDTQGAGVGAGLGDVDGGPTRLDAGSGQPPRSDAQTPLPPQPQDGGPAEPGADAGPSAPQPDAGPAEPQPDAGPAEPDPDPDPVPVPETVELDFDFEDGAEGWTAGFTDYPVEGKDKEFKLGSGVVDLPKELEEDGHGFFIQGDNHSDDLWMYLGRRVGSAEGLVPDQAYRIRFEWRFATSAASGCVGIGGAPGESVFMKVGATPAPLERRIEIQKDPPSLPPGQQDGEEYWAFSADKGNQGLAGDDATLAGNVASGLLCATDNGTWVLLERSREHRQVVTTDPEGELSVFIGTDSGFEGLTELYYDRIVVRFEPVVD